MKETRIGSASSADVAPEPKVVEPAAPGAPGEDQEQQPVEFPVDFEEWAAEQRVGYRLLVAGFRQAVRIEGQLRTRQLRARWSEAFTRFSTARPGTVRVRR